MRDFNLKLIRPEHRPAIYREIRRNTEALLLRRFPASRDHGKRPGKDGEL